MRVLRVPAVLLAGGLAATGAVTPVLLADGSRSRFDDVANHVSHVLAKLQVRDRTQAALRMRGLE